MDHPPYLKPKKKVRRLKDDTVTTDSPIRDEEVVPLLSPLPRVVNTIEENGGGDRAPEGPMAGGKTNNDRDTDRSHDGSRDVIDDLQKDHGSTIVLPVVNMI